MSCPHDYRDPVDRGTGRASISDEYVGVMVNEVAEINQPEAHGR
jgi:hypothetical protein